MWPRYSAFTDEERREDIDRVRSLRTERLSRFCAGVRNVLSESVPATVDGVRELIESGQADGRICSYRLSGNLWLSRLLGKMGYQFAAVRRDGAVMLRPAEERVFDAWAKACVRRAPDMDISLGELDDGFFRWSTHHPEHAEAVMRIGYKKLAAWLRSEGYRSVRRGEGVVFLGIDAIMLKLKRKDEPI